MTKKGENIYKRKDGRWEGRYIAGRYSNGSIKYGSVYGEKYSIVKDKLTKIKAQTLSEKPLKAYKGTLSDWLVNWLNAIAASSIKESTYSNYLRHIDTISASNLGKKMLHTITSEEVQYFVYSLQNKNLSPGSIKNITNMLKKALTEAENVQYILENPCNNVTYPKLKGPKVHAITIEEQQKLEAVAIKDKGCSPVILALYSGMRIGEISGLKWSDIDFEQQTIMVNRTVYRVLNTAETTDKTKVIETTPKSAESVRKIPIADNLTNYLIEKKKHSQSEYVVSKKDKAMEPRAISYRFKKTLKQANLENIKFHALRHTFATRCLENGVDVASVSKLLGHQSIKMTLDTYADSMMSNRIVAMNQLDKSFIFDEEYSA